MPFVVGSSREGVPVSVFQPHSGMFCAARNRTSAFLSSLSSSSWICSRTFLVLALILFSGACSPSTPRFLHSSSTVCLASSLETPCSMSCSCRMANARAGGTSPLGTGSSLAEACRARNPCSSGSSRNRSRSAGWERLGRGGGGGTACTASHHLGTGPPALRRRWVARHNRSQPRRRLGAILNPTPSLSHQPLSPVGSGLWAWPFGEGVEGGPSSFYVDPGRRQGTKIGGEGKGGNAPTGSPGKQGRTEIHVDPNQGREIGTLPDEGRRKIGRIRIGEPISHSIVCVEEGPCTERDPIRRRAKKGSFDRGLGARVRFSPHGRARPSDPGRGFFPTHHATSSTAQVLRAGASGEAVRPPTLPSYLQVRHGRSADAKWAKNEARRAQHAWDPDPPSMGETLAGRDPDPLVSLSRVPVRKGKGLPFQKGPPRIRWARILRQRLESTSPDLINMKGAKMQPRCRQHPWKERNLKVRNVGRCRRLTERQRMLCVDR